VSIKLKAVILSEEVATATEESKDPYHMKDFDAA
jgi:hypothetical protein